MTRSTWVLAGLGLSTALFAACGDDPAKPVAAAGSAGQAGSSAGTGGKGSAGSSPADGGEPSDGGKSAQAEGGTGHAGAPLQPEGGATAAGGASEGGSGASDGEGGAGGAPVEPVIDPECDYLEAGDLTNGNYPPEDSSLTLDLDNTIVICGQIDPGHWDTGTTDDDQFYYSVATAGQFVATLELETESYPGSMQIAGRPAGNAGPSSPGRAIGSRGGAWGEHYMDGYASTGVTHYVDTDELEQPIKYKIRVRMVAWKDACVTPTAAAAAQTYSEANDGAGNIGNDVLRINLEEVEQPATPGDTDAPELSNIVLGAGEKSLIEGTLADVTHGSEAYKDGDMFRFRSGDMDQLTIRLDWIDPYNDFDFFLFKENDYLGELGAYTADVPEIRSILVEPNKNYWLWVGAYEDSTSLPEAYKISLCGAAFTP
ncbi:MAG TPA: hypothetical protein VEX18_11795 [Polyangiaceae bacterium]|nr:hypothetical protein [Polyangiaceae bacterium]